MTKISTLILSVFLLGSTAYADELIKDFKEDSVVVLNEELRIKQERIDALSSRIETLEGATDDTGALVQKVSAKTGAVATGNTAIPIDDTIPQNTEGDEYITLSIDPESASNKLLIIMDALVSYGGGSGAITMALFQDTTADALAVATENVTGGQMNKINLIHEMDAGTASSTTFKMRIGSDAGSTITLNGVGGSRRFGGVAVSSITIMETQA